MGILSRFSPFMEQVGIDEAYLDITGFDALHGSPRQLALKLKRQVKEELGLAVSVGIAPCKVIAKVASDLSKPDGLLEVAPGSESSFLSPLTLSKLPGIGPRTEETLKKRGIYTLGQLAALPSSTMKFWLGKSGEMLHLFARGIDPRGIEPPSAARSISRSTTFIWDTLDAAFLRAHLRYLAERVGAELRQQGRAARSVVLKLRYADFETITRRRTLKEPSDADQAIFNTGLELLERALKERRKLVRLVGIGVSGLIAACRQLHLWEKTVERQALLDQALDRLRQKYGYGSLQTGQTFLLKDFLPLSREGYLLHTPSLSPAKIGGLLI